MPLCCNFKAAVRDGPREGNTGVICQRKRESGVGIYLPMPLYPSAFPRNATRKCNGRDSNPQLFVVKSPIHYAVFPHADLYRRQLDSLFCVRLRHSRRQRMFRVCLRTATPKTQDRQMRHQKTQDRGCCAVYMGAAFRFAGVR